LAEKVIVLKGRVIDGNGGPVIEKGVVAVEGNKITAVANAHEYPIPEGAEVIEIEDGTIMPGFIEQHTHIGMCTANFVELYLRHPFHSVCMAIDDLKKIRDSGFTTIRELGGFTNYLKEAQVTGLIDTPRICSAGRIITQTGGHGDYIKKFPVEYNLYRNIYAVVADGVPEVRKQTRLNLREGSDFIKIMTSAGVTSQSATTDTQEFADEEIRAIVEEAEKFGTYVASHCISNKGIRAAVRCGVKSLEHAMFLDEETVEEIAKAGAWIVPTFAIAHRYMTNLDKVQPWTAKKIQLAYDQHYKSFELARKAGIKLGFGCDFVGDYAICPNGPNGMEFERLVAAGMTNMEAICAATKVGSEIVMRPDEIGTLEVGKLADIVVAKGDPLKDITVCSKTENIKVVMQDGVIKKHIN